MLDYLKRFLIAVIMGLFVSLLFLGGKQIDTGMPSLINSKTVTYLSNCLPIASQSIFF